MVRTRFAPSPTGYMHLGNLRSALYAYLFAKNQKGQFILRIEDTDQEREIEGAVARIYSVLRQVNFIHDEGPDIGGSHAPYIQSQRREIYREYAEKIMAAGEGYPCFCTPQRLADARERVTAQGGTFRYDKHCADIPREEAAARMAAGEPFCVRQNMPTEGQTSFDDLLYGHITVENAELDDMVLFKTDGLPTYNFANVIDDHLMGITHVLRGSEYLSSTPKYNRLYAAFGWQPPVYVHLPLVMADATRKLSKRMGDPSFEDLLQMGYLKEAVLNYIALLGWSPGTDEEFFTLDELIERFSLNGLSRHPAIFDMEKLTWFNASYIRRLTPEAFLQAAMPYAADTILPGLSAEKQRLVAEQLTPRVTRFTELPGMLEACFEAIENFDFALYDHGKMKTNAALAATLLPLAARTLAGVSAWSVEGLKAALAEAAQEAGVKNGQVLFLLRAALSGRASTPCGAFELAVLAGREETLRRLAVQTGRLG